MPSPIGHSLMGYIIYRGSTNSVVEQKWPVILLYLFIANAADLDFIPGFLVGDPNHYHHGVSHSVGLAVLFAALCGFLLLLLKSEAFTRNFTIFFCLYFSHIALDYFSIDTSFPYGVPIFWPLTNEYYIAPLAFLPDIWRASSSGVEFFISLLSLHNLWAITAEFLLLSPGILLLSALIKRAGLSRN